MTKTADLYRTFSTDHRCPYGLKAKDLLKRQGYNINDHLLNTPEQTSAFKQQHNVKTTPQAFINGKRIGGYDDLVAYFGKTTLQQTGTTYQPVIAIFSTTLCMAIALAYAITERWAFTTIIEMFIALSMCVLGIMKLRDLFSFSNQFLGYDLLAQHWVRYAYIYPFIETGAGILMIAGVFIWLAAPAALVIGTIGGISVFKAVYIDKRALKCACVGGNSNVPLGFISFTENAAMVFIALWMLLKQV